MKEGVLTTQEVQVIVGRSRKSAKRQNYKISYRLLAGLKGIATLEDRSDTAQLERWLKEGIERWRLENPSKEKELDALVSSFLSNEGVEESEE